MFRLLVAGAAGLMLLTGAAFAQDLAGGAIKVSTIAGKEVLTDKNGMTLYTFGKDTPGVSTCYAQCAVNWPPAFAAADAKAEGDFTIVDRTDGTKVWAYKGMPLYLWIKDTAPGQTTGDGVGGNWFTAVK